MSEEDIRYLVKAYTEKLLKKLADPLVENIELQAVAKRLDELLLELDRAK